MNSMWKPGQYNRLYDETGMIALPEKDMRKRLPTNQVNDPNAPPVQADTVAPGKGFAANPKEMLNMGNR